MTTTALPDAATAPAAPSSDRHEEFGRTAADARRLAKRTMKIFVRIPVGPAGDTTPLLMSRPMFLRLIKYIDDPDLLPCRLYQQCCTDELRLSVGWACYFPAEVQP